MAYLNTILTKSNQNDITTTRKDGQSIVSKIGQYQDLNRRSSIQPTLSSDEKAGTLSVITDMSKPEGPMKIEVKNKVNPFLRYNNEGS